VIETKIQSQEHSIKPIVYNSFPYLELDDRVFEILLFLIHKKEIEDQKHLDVFDDVTLMQGVGEKGMDCVLHFEGKIVGLIQCKNYQSKLSKPEAAREIIKFSLYYILDNTLISEIDNFTYFLVASSGFNGVASLFLSSFNTSIEDEEDLQKWVEEVISKYETFKSAGLTFDNVKDLLIPVLKTIKVKKVTPEELNQKMDENPAISKRFFKIHVVTSEEEIIKLREEISKTSRMSFDVFLAYVNNEILNLNVRNPEIKTNIIQRADVILEKLYDMGEEKFDKFIKAIKVPFKNKFADKTPIIYEENLSLLSDIIIKVILISLVNPELEFTSEKGQSIKLGDEIISLIFSENNEEYDLVILQLLKHFNGITDDLGHIKTVVVGNSFPNACVLGGKGADLDFEYVIDQIIDVKPENHKEEFTNLRNRFDFNYHCQSTFNFKTLRTYNELEKRLSDNFRGNNVGQGDGILHG
jgi:hypothetical protein